MTVPNLPTHAAVQRPQLARANRLALPLVALAVLSLAACTAPQQGWGGAVTADSAVFFASPNGKVYKLQPQTREANPSGIVPTAGEWEFPAEKDKRVGHFYAPPTVGEQAVFVASTPAGANPEGKLYALNPQNGSVLWEYPKPDQKDARKLGLLVGAPAVSGSMVFTSDGHQSLLALDATTGEVKWTFPTGNKVWSTPAVANGVVYFGSLDHSVYALQAATGNKVWEFKAGGAVPGSPLVTRDTVYIGAADNKLYALDAATGAKKWEFAARNWFWTQPVLHNGIIYANALDHRVYAINAATGEPAWPAPYQAPKLVLAPPVITGDLLAITTEAGAVISLDLASGQPRSSRTVEPASALYGPGAAGNGIAYVPGVDNYLYAVEAATGRTLWTFKAS